jgi:hypothetical protein
MGRIERLFGANLARASLSDECPTRRHRPMVALLQLDGLLVEQPSNPVHLDLPAQTGETVTDAAGFA